MKNLLLTLTLLICASTVTAVDIPHGTLINRMTDYQCMSDCSAKGYMYQYCLKLCSY